MDNKTLAKLNRRFALYATGRTMSSLAADLNISLAAVSGALGDLYTSAPVAKRLAEITGKPLNELWPDGKYQHLEVDA